MHDHEWLKEAVLIIFSLGGLETLFWWLDRLELREQTELLKEIADSLYVEEKPKEKVVEPTSHN